MRAMFKFASPYYLLLLFVLAAACFYRRKKQFKPHMAVSSLLAVKKMPFSPALKIKGIITAFRFLAIFLMIIALARPQWGTRQTTIMTEGINIILAVDLSESMAALDFRRKNKIINRLEAAKGVIKEFISQRKGDRIGMVVFGSQAYTQMPLTRDYNTIISILDRLKIGAAGKSTAIGDAIGISIKRLADIPSKSNTIILLTDGRSNSGEISPDVAGEIAGQQGIRIYTIGIGTRGRVPFLVKNPVFGERYVYQRVDIDEKTLESIAKKTKGQYFRAENIKGLKKIYTTINQLEKSKVEVQTFNEYNELYDYILILVLGLWGGWIILKNTRYLDIP